MSFFNRRKGDERRSESSHENSSCFNGSEKRNGKDRRSRKDRRMDLYHQMEPSRRSAIYRIIEIMEQKIGE